MASQPTMIIAKITMENKKNQNLREIVTEGVHIREVEGKESRIITGCAIVFNTETTLYTYDDKEYRELILPEAVPQSLLDESDIKMTMFHNRELILARSNKGKGTLRYSRDDKGVYFEFEAPNTVDGDKALALVRSGDLSGCSFAFTIRDWDTFEDVEVRKEGDTTIVLSKIREIAEIRDFTIAADPAYPTTEVKARCREMLGAADAECGAKDAAAETKQPVTGEREIAALRHRLAVRNR